jgi:hypothetical protein
MIVDGMKKCSKCGETKPILEFYKKTRSPDGLTSNCKTCILERMSKYYLKNTETIITKNLKYRSEHKEERNIRDRKYRLKHLEEIRLRDRLRYIRNPTKYLNNKRYSHTINGRLISSRYVSKRRNSSINLKNDLNLRQWTKILEMQNNKCAICETKFNDDLISTKDHIIPVSNPFCPGLTFGNTQALCFTCNVKKGNNVYFMRGIYTLLEYNMEI